MSREELFSLAPRHLVPMANRYAPIEDYGIIGDLHTVALVGKDASMAVAIASPTVFTGGS